MRETMGLLQKRWKQEILLLIVLILFTFVPPVTTGIVQLIYGSV